MKEKIYLSSPKQNLYTKFRKKTFPFCEKTLLNFEF